MAGSPDKASLSTQTRKKLGAILQALCFGLGVTIMAGILAIGGWIGDLAIVQKYELVLLIAVFALAMIIIAPLLRWAPPQISLVLVAVCFAVGIALIVLGFMVLDFDQARANEHQAEKPKTLNIWQYDERFGYNLRPNVTGQHSTLDFNVKYTIGPDQTRITPTPDPSAGRILFVGCSYTFGYGVEDNECYPNILATGAWSQYKVINKSAMGWGTVHAYLSTMDYLNSDDPPKLVVYAFIRDHLRRNYLRKQWMQTVLNHPAHYTLTGDPKLDRRGHPHVELVDGKIKYLGVVGLDESVKGTPDVIAKEVELTSALLAEMNQACKQKNVRFVILLMPDNNRDTPWPKEVFDNLQDEQIEIMDLSTMQLAGFGADPHPNKVDHAWIAWAVAEKIKLASPSDQKRP